MSRQRLTMIGGYLRQHWRRLGSYGLGVIVGLLVIVQLSLPWNNLPLYAVIDGRDVGGKSFDDAAKDLDASYKKLPIKLYFGDGKEPYRQPHPSDIGLKVATKQQVESMAYPLWLRLIPTSVWWAHSTLTPAEPTYSHDLDKAKSYIEKELGESCDVQPKNATVKYEKSTLKVVPASDGGTCKLEDVEKMLGKVTPRLNESDVRIAMNPRPAIIRDEQAREFADMIRKKSTDVAIKAGSELVEVPQATFLGWLEFQAPDSGLVAVVNTDKSSEFFTKQLAPKVTTTAGTSRVTTLDFTEISRANGAPGQALDGAATIERLNSWLAGDDVELVAGVRAVEPKVVYTRTYTSTDTGMSALLAQFAQAHPGTFGISFAELDGKRRYAMYQGNKVFRTASTYKLFVAYSTLKRVEAGQWHWSDQVQGGRDLAKCFDDMIVKSDNPCAETLLGKIGFRTITNEIKSAGLQNSSFLNDFIETTASDQTTFVGALQSGQLLNPDSTNRLISAMKRNIYRSGIPSGANGTVADKVGFLNGLLHDTAIVYTSSGTYVLSIMSDGSSWGTIAELTREIEKLRSQ